VDAGDDSPFARAPEPEDLARICGALNRHGARYLLIGGFAVIAHGAGRFTKDIDLLVDDSPDNGAARGAGSLDPSCEPGHADSHQEHLQAAGCDRSRLPAW